MEISPLADHQNFIDELAELHHLEWGHLDRSFTLEKRIEAISQAAGCEGIPSIFIAASEGQLIGLAALVHQDMTTRPDFTPWLAAVYVKKDFRHQGIASDLIARCEPEAVRAGATIWYLYTESASGLYEKLGWQSMEHCEYRGVTVNVMRKKIASR